VAVENSDGSRAIQRLSWIVNAHQNIQITAAPAATKKSVAMTQSTVMANRERRAAAGSSKSVGRESTERARQTDWIRWRGS
jgi:hypothetical protein